MLIDDLLKFHCAEAEMLAARTDGLRNVLRRGRRQHKDHVSWRLFQGLEQSIEGRISDLVGFIEDVNLEPVARGTITGCLPQLANFIDTAVGSRVDFNLIDRIARTNLDAGIANPAWFRNWLLRRAEIHRHLPNTRHCRLACLYMPADNVH